MLRLRTAFAALRARLLDFCHALANYDQPSIPPPSLRTVGGGDFHRLGAHNVRNMKQFAELDGKTILEIGCGSGRNALALATYDVEYHGFDIFAPYIKWCRTHISAAYPRFHFHHADVYNGAYNRSGTTRSDAFRFPFADATFDLVFLTSVFTHMLEPEVMHYLREIARLMRDGGAVYATFFLLDAEANGLMTSGRAHRYFQPFDGERVKVHAHHIPELAVAYAEPIIT
jgi:SAM-dependent methyltransferase